MTAFGKTILGKALGKGVKVAVDSNPITRSAKNLLSGATSQNKQEAKNKVLAQKAAPQKSSTDSTSAGGFFQKNKTVLGFTFPVWIWFAILTAIVVILYFVLRWIFKKRRGGTTRRRSSGSSSMRARMARVRSYRRKKK